MRRVQVGASDAGREVLDKVATLSSVQGPTLDKRENCCSDFFSTVTLPVPALTTKVDDPGVLRNGEGGDHPAPTRRQRSPVEVVSDRSPTRGMQRAS
jgi:hypothetical protein